MAPNVRSNAIPGIGRLARLYGALDETRFRPLIDTALGDPNAYVRNQDQMAASDLKHFLHWRSLPD